MGLLTASLNRELYYTNICRVMVKLNDRKALETYSELSFKEEEKSMGVFRSNKLKTVVGARIIKPDGSVREINVEEDAVAITEGKKDKEAFKKLAIKGLETGDILDYFYSEEMELENLNISPLTFPFFSKNPTLSYSVECILGKKLTTEYRSVNGAPDFEVSEDEDGNTILRVARNGLVIADDLEETRWVSVYRDLPMIRLMILNNASNLTYKPASARKSGVYKDVKAEEILKDKKNEFSVWSARMYQTNDTYKKVRKAVANYKQKIPETTDDDLACYLYDALRFYWPDHSTFFPPERFYISLEKILKENNIECKICFVTNRYGARKEEIVEAGDLSVFVSANENRQLFFFPNGYRYAGEIPGIFEGEHVSAVAVHKYKKNNPVGIEGVTSEFNIRESSFEENKSTVKTVVAFSEGNPLELKINRNTISSGDWKNDYVDGLVLYDDWDKEMRKRLLIDTDFWQDMESDRYDRKYIDRYKIYFEDKRKEQKEIIQSEFKEYHSINSGELIGYSVKKIGATIDDPLFEFEMEYTIDGLVKAAGNNLVFDAGKLIGTQWIPSEKERARNLDAYLPTPICIENEILITIPEQYTVEDIDNLNKQIENEWGKFTSSASLDGNMLKITATKIYKKNFVSKSNWNELLEMIDKTNEFYSQSVILKYTI